MTTDLKTSILVNRQVPEFVREDHPKFISFLEAYYEFLEQKQGTQVNDLITRAKDLRYVSDVDYSIGEFEKSFINNFATLIPQDALVDKDFLIKNVLPLYLARGNQKSFELLFRLLYNSEVDITFPKDFVLRASDGKWIVENVLRINNEVYSYHTGTGTKNTFLLAQQVTADDVSVYVDGTLTTTGFYIRREDKKLIFNSAPANGAIIEVFYDNFDETLFANRKITGLTSGATAIVERAAPRLITQQTSIELYIDDATLLGSFLNAETITTDIIGDDGSLVIIRSDTVATLTSITVTNGGASYNVGDPVTIIGGGFQTRAEAVVDEVSTGYLDTAIVNFGGAGFQVGGIINGTENGSSVFTGAILTVDSSGANTTNTYSIFTDVISPYVDVVLSSADYGFPSTAIPAGENIATVISQALSPGVLTGIGPITTFSVLFSNTSTANSLILDSDGAKIETLGGTFLDIRTFGSLGRIRINNGGSGYKIGDEIIFGANPAGTYGSGAAAAVTAANSTGSITKIEFQPSRITGNANTQASNVMVVGTGTSFDTELAIGDRIMINSEIRFVNSISSATSLNVNVAFTRTSTNNKVGAFDRHIIGGEGYVQNNFPTITVSSVAGTGANVELISIMGDSERLSASASAVAGRINRIKVTNPGSGYLFVPTIDLSQRGDGNATATAEIERTYVSFPGKWVTSDSIISSLDRKIQGLDYYIDFTYLTSVATEFSKYKEILKGLLHPAGFKNYAEYPINRVVDANSTTIGSVTQDVSGNVSVSNNSIYVTGINTRFNVANSLGIFTLGSRIAVANQIRTVNAIISNTSLTVSSIFTTNASAQTLIVVT